MQRDEVRQALGAALGRAVDDPLWKYLVDLGFADEVVNQRADVEYLVEQVHRIFEAAGTTRRAPRMARAHKPARLSSSTWALSRLVAQIANEDADIRAFRHDALEAEMLAWKDLKDWVTREAQDAGPPTTYLTLPLPRDARIVRDPSGTRLIKPPLHAIAQSSLGTKMLSYFGPRDDRVRLVPTTAGSSLDRLRRLCETIAPAYGWHEAQAAVFVLADVTPIIEPVSITIRSEPFRKGRSHTWARRVVLDVDPTMPPEAVRDAYSSVRAELGLRTTRTLSDKHTELAAHCYEPQYRTWSRRFKDWNRRYPDWRYTHETNFRRDAARALRHLLAPGDHGGKVGATTSLRGETGDLHLVVEGNPLLESSADDAREFISNVLAALKKAQTQGP